MKKSIPLIIVILFLGSVSTFASGEQEKNEEFLLTTKKYTENEKAELWESAVVSFSELSKHQPETLTVSCELTNSKYQTLLEQNAEVIQDIVDGELSRTINPIVSEEEANPPGGGSKDRSGDRGSGGPQEGGNSSGKGGSQGDDGPRDDSRSEDVNNGFSFNYELVGTVVGLWDKSFEIIKTTGEDLIHGDSIGDIEEIFNFTCMEFYFSNNEIEGSVWIDVEKGIPVKTIMKNPVDGNLEMELFILPGQEQEQGQSLLIARMFYSKSVVSEDGQELLMKGSVTPD